MATEKIVRVTFSDRVMLFGNSYKPWHLQFDEYVGLQKRNGIHVQLERVESSDAKWVSFGGLKWCQENNFQQQLNREGCQADEPDNPNPRLYSEIVFEEDPKAFTKAKKIMDKTA